MAGLRRSARLSAVEKVKEPTTPAPQQKELKEGSIIDNLFFSGIHHRYDHEDTLLGLNSAEEDAVSCAAISARKRESGLET